METKKTFFILSVNTIEQKLIKKRWMEQWENLFDSNKNWKESGNSKCNNRDSKKGFVRSKNNDRNIVT